MRSAPTRARNISSSSADGNKVEQRPVTLGPVIDGLRVVVSGLKPEDQVIVNGIMKARPGSEVKVEQGKMEQYASDQLEQKPMVSGGQGGK